MKSAVENAQRFAMFDVPLLIQGETGTGDVYKRQDWHCNYKHHRAYYDDDYDGAYKSPHFVRFGCPKGV